jgi:hypothetical protein
MMPWPRAAVGQGADMDWARILAYVTGTVDQELLARNEYLAAENRILKVQLNGRLKLSDAERGVLGEIGHPMASDGVPTVLALEVSRSGWSAEDTRGYPAPDPGDEPGQSAVGRTPHPW